MSHYRRDLNEIDLIDEIAENISQWSDYLHGEWAVKLTPVVNEVIVYFVPGGEQTEDDHHVAMGGLLTNPAQFLVKIERL